MNFQLNAVAVASDARHTDRPGEPEGPRLALSPVTVRLLLRVEAAACGLFGLLAVVAAGAVTGPLDAPTPLLVVGGLVLLVYAVEAAFVARRPTHGWLLALAGSTAPSLPAASLLL